jgi:integrase
MRGKRGEDRVALRALWTLPALSGIGVLPDKRRMSSTESAKEADEPTVEVVSAGTELVLAPSAALTAARQRADEYRRHTKASETQRGYKGDWARFLAWATASGAVALPATPETVSLHLVWLADRGLSVGTIERFLTSARHYHLAAGFDFPRNAYAVSETMKGIRRTVGVERTKRAPLGLKALSEACERAQREAEHHGKPDVGLQQRAMLTVGWWCMLRSANLVAIRREHVRLVRVEDDDWVDDSDQPNGLILHLPGSKTDQLKRGRDVAVHAQADESVCPVRALAAHLDASRLAAEELIFPVSSRTVSRLIKRLAANPAHGHSTMREIAACEACATAARRFASHSLRRGSATTQARKGVANREIMHHGGWKSEKVMLGYVEDATLFENNPTKGLANKK